MWDVFISHAAEDKDAIARPLAEALTEAGFKVWYDDFTLTLGDSLNRSIDRGLAETRYGIVILSSSFFAKEWPRRELDGLTSREVSSGKVILPVWHKISRTEVERFSPILADKLGVSTDKGLDVVVREILHVLREEPVNRKPVPPPKRRWWRIFAAIAVLIVLMVAGMLGYRYYQRDIPPDVSGKWVIEATKESYKTYLNLQMRDGKFSGTTKILFPNHPDIVISGLYARRQASILEGQVNSGTLSFKTSRARIGKIGESSTLTDLVHHYEGRIDGQTIHFTVQVEGAYSEEVTAERVPDPITTAELVATLEGHTGSVDQIALLPDGRLASGSRDRTVKIWNLSTRQAEVTFEHGSQVRAVIPLAGERILSAEADGKLRIWNLPSRNEQLAFERIDGLVETVVSVGDGILAGSWSRGEITLWNIATGRITKTLRIDDRWILRMARLHDGRLATSDQDGTIRIWNLSSGKPEILLRSGTSAANDVSGLETLEDGRLAFSTAHNDEVTLWNPTSEHKEVVASLRKCRWAEILGVFEDGRLAVSYENGDITLWNPVTRKHKVALNVEEEPWAIGTVKQLPDGQLALGTGNGPIQLWKSR